MKFMYSNHRWNPLMKEPANIAVNLVKFFSCAPHLLATIVVLSQIFIVDCGAFLSLLTAQTYNTSGGKVCYYCAPGQHWVGDCINTVEVARCQPCLKGFFQTVENIAHTCQQCTKDCPQLNQELIDVCNATTDNICQCSSGYFKLNDEGFCKKHRTCPSGQGVKNPGNKDTDTVCEVCIEGKTFSGNDSAIEGCLPCTRCEVLGLYEMMPCTSRSDAKCGPDGPNNLKAIVGGTVGSVIGVIIIVLVVVWCFKRHQQLLQSSQDDSEGDPFTVQQILVPLNGGGNLHISQNSDYSAASSDDSGHVSADNNASQDQSNLQNGDRPMVHTNHRGIPLSVLKKLSIDLISQNWKFFFRELSVTESELDQVQIDHHGSVQEQIYQLLHHLNQKGCLTKSSIMRALEGIKRNDLASKYSKEEFPDD